MPSRSFCSTCPNPLQTYFVGKMVLPCAYCTSRPKVRMPVPFEWGDGCVSRVSILFTRVSAVAADRCEWRAEPCLDRTVNAGLTGALICEGLEGCFDDQPVDGIFKYTGPTPSFAFDVNAWSAEVSRTIAERNQQQAAAGQHGVGQANNQVWPGAESALCNAQQAADQQGARQQAVAAGLGQINAQDWRRAELGRWLVPRDGSAPTYLPPDTAPTTPVTYSDYVGRGERASIPDAVAGCRLGCRCSVHRPAKPAPYIPTVDEYDLLPDV
jgi:hypothetical protein